MSYLNEWVSVVPARGQSLQAVARELLALADDPSHVRTARAGHEFLVHPLVAEKYTAPPKPKRTARSKPKTESEES